MPDLYPLNPTDPFEKLVIEMVEVNRRKRKDYAGTRGPWANFIDSSNQVGLSPGHSVEILIGTKQARLRTLLPQVWATPDQGPANESIRDTILDRAVYSVIALGMHDDGLYAFSYDFPSVSKY